MPLHQLVANAAEKHGHRPALLQGETVLCYADAAAQCWSAAAGFYALDVTPGARLAIYLGKGIEAVLACFAASAAGLVFVPVNPLLKARQVAHILQHSGAEILLTTSDRLHMLLDGKALPACLRHVVLTDDPDSLGLSQGPITTHLWGDLLKQPPVRPDLSGSVNDGRQLAALFYTSGSTGNAKGVMFSHRNLLLGAQSVASYLRNTAEDRIVSVLPLSFDYGWSQITTAFQVGASVALLTYLLPRDVLRALEAFAGTGLAAVPPLWQELAQLEWPPGVRNRLRYITSSGGHMPRQTVQSLRRLLPGTAIYLMYGLTEAFRSTYLPPDQVDRLPDSIGKAIPHAQVRVLHRDGTPCAPGETGEIVHSGPLVSMGYWQDADATAARFRPVPGESEPSVWSGDLARTDAEGYLYFVARGDDMIKTSGYRVSPGEVEEALCALPGITEAAVFGLPDAELGQAIAAVLAGPCVPDEQRLYQAMRQELPGFMVPRRVKVLDRLPRSANGKIDRVQLRRDLPEMFP